MTRLVLVVLVVSLVLLCAGEAAAGSADGSTVLLEDVYESRTFGGANGTDGTLVVYCNPGESPSYLALFKSLYIEFRLVPEQYSLFEGADAGEVRSKHAARLASWMPLLPWRQSTIGFPTFRPHCVGLVSDEVFRFEFVVRQANYWKIFQLCLGVVLFFTVPSLCQLCRNVLVFLSADVKFSVVAWFVLTVLILIRWRPIRSTAYSVLFFGLWLLQLLWPNLYDVLEQYKHLLAGYVAMSALVSFVFCYRLGPDLLQWSLQLLSLGLVFLSSELREVTGAVVLVLLAAYNFPAAWSARLRTHWKRRFPPEERLLTEDEYLQPAPSLEDECRLLNGGRVPAPSFETSKELARLREFCASPDCNAWTLVTKLKDPVRFALFVQGQSHLADDEVLQYELDYAEDNPAA